MVATPTISSETPVNTHKNARTTPYVRVLMAARRAEGWSVGEIAEAAGVSVRTVYKWLARKSAETRSSRARRLANRLPEPLIQEIARLRRERRLTAIAIARRMRLARSTVAGWLKRLGMGRLKLLDPKPPVQRYERERAGELVHIDIKKLGRFNQIGHRISGQRIAANGSPGWDFVHVAIDDATRLAYVEILADEKKESAIEFLQRTVIWLRRQKVKAQRVMTDNGSCYRSKEFAHAVGEAGLRHLRTRPYTPRTNGKAERFIQTLLREWAYAKAYRNSGRRTASAA